jgi:hypothetical protein
VKFKIDVDQIKTRDLVESETSLKLALKLMSRFVVDESGNPVPEDTAYEQLLDLNIREQQSVSEQFTSAIIPNLKGRRS